ncbi:MAG: hypothetical protein SOV63_08230 [Pyramidobacter porci]|uniref:hypothetical protein n=1 Tax=Pyramidobacter porci TaxID=2605789 RepID=UPI002A761E89|nr:hypothetical protein [Pyramidobacter porci]MDY2648778.1 hypothetical protein [Pyramidobacter porci]
MASIHRELLKTFFERQDERTQAGIKKATEKMVEVKKNGGKIVVACGSGPNIHEGVTTLIAELMDKGIIDGVTTSSAVVGHEMAGALDRVKMVSSDELGFDPDDMPRGNVFEFTCMTPDELAALKKQIVLDDALLAKKDRVAGHEVIKAAGNMAYPMGYWNEHVASEICDIARTYALPFEVVAGWGCDRRTMLGVGAAKNLPVLVSLPQMVGGGNIGSCIGDSIPIRQRCMRVARMLEDADVIIESAIALSQELHDGPFEKYTGHGIWAWWNGMHTYNLRGKTLIRLDLDENLRRACDSQAQMQEAIAKGLPKTKISGIPFRMEMSAFARHEGSIPLIGDIGEVWPVLAIGVADVLGVELDFMSYKQETAEGKAMREWIVDNVKPLDIGAIRAKALTFRL